MKRAERVIAASVLTFVCWVTAAVALYPGGTWNDHATVGFDPLHNLLCDLLLPVAIDGQPNRGGAALAAAAMIALVLGLSLAFWSVRRLVPGRPALTAWIRACGVISTPGLALVPLSPPSATSRFDGLHAAAVFLGGAPALLAAVLTFVALKGRLALLGTLAVALVAADIAVYGEYLTHGGDVPFVLPLLERPAVLLILAWLIAFAVELKRRGREA